jgi:hypothetical protein
MKMNRIFAVLLAVIMCIGVVTGCFERTPTSDPEPTPEPTEAPTPPLPTPTPEPTPTPVPVNLVEYDGVVEQLFFHELIAYPELAFPNRNDPHRVDAYLITVGEFNRILKSLHRNNFVLIDLRDIWSEFTDENGNLRMRRNTLMIPEGKKPIVLSFDDLTFHQKPYEAFMQRYIIGPDGEIWAEGIDPNGDPIITQDLTAITILEKFIRENPDFSHNGAKGCIAQTGLYGILGYRTQTNREDNTEEFRLNRMKEIARAKPVIDKLIENGWYWASHSWGHIRFEDSSLERIRADAERWNDEVASLVGDTNIMIYAHGSRLDGNDVWRETAGPALRYYVDDLGFRLFASVGREPFTRIRSDVPAVMLDRMASDGITLRGVINVGSRERFMRFYDAKEVFDPLRPDLPVNWD